MARSDATQSHSRTFVLVLVVSVVAVLYLAQAILIPFALAVLLAFLLSPLVLRLQRWHLGRITSVILVVALAFGGISLVAWVMVDQLLDLTASLPEYQETLRDKIRSVRGPAGGVITRATETIEELRRELESDPPADDAFGGPPVETAETGEEGPPVPVEVVSNTVSPVEYLSAWLGPLLEPLGQAGIVVVFVIFMLIEREDLRDRVIRLVGESQVHVTTQVLDDAAGKVSRYLRMQLIINVTYGVAVGAGLALIGLPNAILWGLLATILRFIPYVGPWVAALMPVALSLAVFDGWTRVMAAIALFVVLELIVNNVLEPWLYGSSTGVSMVGIIASAVFWAWLWGPVGLVLATPLTVCLTVLGGHVPQLRFLNVLLSDGPVLSPSLHFYQRLLAMDQEELNELWDEFLESKTLDQLYDEILIPTLSLAEQDRHGGNLSDAEWQFIQQTVRELVDAWQEVPPEPAVMVAAGSGARVLCLPARDEADALAAQILAGRLCQLGHEAEAVTLRVLASEAVELVSSRQIQVVIISAVPPLAALHARYRIKRLRERLPELKIVVGLWDTTTARPKTRASLLAAGADRVVTTFAEAYAQVRLFGSSRVAPSSEQKPPQAAGDRPVADDPAEIESK